MFTLLKAMNNLREGIFIKANRRLLAPSRSERQNRIMRKQTIEFENSMKSQGIGYGYDFRNVKKHKPKRYYHGCHW